MAAATSRQYVPASSSSRVTSRYPTFGSTHPTFSLMPASNALFSSPYQQHTSTHRSTVSFVRDSITPSSDHSSSQTVESRGGATTEERKGGAWEELTTKKMLDHNDGYEQLGNVDHDEDDEDMRLPSLSPSALSSSSNESEDDEFDDVPLVGTGFSTGAFFSESHNPCCCDSPSPSPNSSLFASLLLVHPDHITSTSPTKRSATRSPTIGRRSRSKRHRLLSPNAANQSCHTAKLPQLVTSSLRRSQPLVPTVQLVSPFDVDGPFIDLPVATPVSPHRDPAPFSSFGQVPSACDLEDDDETFELEHEEEAVFDFGMDLEGESCEGELWDWDAKPLALCPKSPRARPACLSLAPPPPPPTPSLPTPAPSIRVVSNTAQLLMSSLEACMVRGGKIVSPLRQRVVIVRRGKAETISSLRKEILV